MRRQREERHFLIKTFYLQIFKPTPAFVSFLVQPYHCLLFLFSLSKYLLLNLALRKSVCSIRYRITERYLTTHLAQRLREYLFFSVKGQNKGIRTIEPSIASHTHTHQSHTPIIKGDGSSPPSLFASSKSP